MDNFIFLLIFHSIIISERESCSVMSDSVQPHGVYCPWNSPGLNTGVNTLSLLQGIFPTQGLSPGLPHCRWIIYQLSHKGNPRVLEWVAYSFSSRSSQPRNQTRISYTARGFFANWTIREAQYLNKADLNSQDDKFSRNLQSRKANYMQSKGLFLLE